ASSLSSRSSNSRKAACKNSAPFWRTCSSRALKLRQSEGTVKIALSFCTSSAHMGDLTSFLAVVVCVRSPFFRVKWLILPGQPVTPRKRYSIFDLKDRQHLLRMQSSNRSLNVCRCLDVTFWKGGRPFGPGGV